MATLAISYGAGMLGSALGLGIPALGLSGFAVGWTIGGLAANALLADDQTVHGPRLSSLEPPSSSYNKVIPEVLGKHPIRGNFIWAMPIREVETENEEGGKGGGSVTSVTYQYYASFAVAFAAGPAEVPKIWLNDKLVWDQTSTEVMEQYPGVITVYTGTETQQPDALMESHEGVGNVPGHRGLVYVVFNNLPLANFGNAYPREVKGLVDSGAAAAKTAVEAVTESWTFTRQWCATPDGDTIVTNLSTNLHVLNIRDGAFNTTAFSISDDLYGGVIPDCDDEYFYSMDEASLACAVWKINILTGEGTQITAGRSVDLSLFDGNTITCVGDTGIYAKGENLMYGDTRVSIDTECDIAGAGDIQEVIAGVGNDAWVIGTGGSNLYVSLYHRGELIQTWTDTTYTYVDDRYYGFYHGPTQSLILCSDAGVLYKWDTTTHMAVGSITGGASATYTESSLRCARYTGQSRFWTVHTGITGFRTIDLVDFASVNTEASGDWGTAETFYESVYDSRYNVLWWVSTTSADWFKFPLDRLAEGAQITVQSALESLSTSAGLDAADVDATDMSGDYITGYPLEQRVPIRQYVEPLAMGFFFDAVESDDQIKFVKRTGTSLATISQTDLVEISQELVEESITQEVELPNSIEVLFNNPDTDYQSHSTHAKRYDSAVLTRQKRQIVFPYAITVTQAAAIPYKLLHLAWLEKRRYKFALPWEFLKYEPTDVITVEAYGNSFPVTLERITLDENMALQCEGAAAGDVTYSLAASGQANLGYTADVLQAVGRTIFHIMDLPALRTQELNDLYVQQAANGHTAVWYGCVIQKSTDGVDYSQVDSITAEATVGVVANTLADATATVIDRTNTIEVLIQHGTAPTSSTEAGIIADLSVNLALVGDEIIQFATVTAGTDGKYNLTGLIRGRYGTENEIGNHYSGERFILLTEAAIRKLAMASTDVSTTRWFRAISFGNATESGVVKSLTYTGNNLKPWSVVGVTGSWGGSPNDLTINWDRRSRRLAAALWTPALQEGSEDYEVDIMSGSPLAVLRTITTTPSANGSVITAATQTCLYDVADVIADGLTPGDPVTVRIYQLSETVGRGHVKEEIV